MESAYFSMISGVLLLARMPVVDQWEDLRVACEILGSSWLSDFNIKCLVGQRDCPDLLNVSTSNASTIEES